MIVDLCPLDSPKARLAASVPGAFRDYIRRMFVMNTAANEAGVRVAMELFSEQADALQKALALVDTHADTRPLDNATPWAGDRTNEELLPNVAEYRRDRAYRFQVTDVAYAAARIEADGGAYFGHDRGLGKTYMSKLLAEQLGLIARDGLSGHIVVVCPNSAKDPVWRAEINSWYPFENCYTVGGNETQRDRALKTWKQFGGFLLIHYEALRLIDWKNYPADLVVVDEAHRLSNGHAGRNAPLFYKALMKIPTKYRLALSGSVLVNSPEDIFGAIHWLFPKVYASKDRDWCSRFVRYAEGSGFRVCIGVKPDKLSEMRAELGTFLVVRKKEDELEDLPELITQRIFVDLGPAQRKVYDDMAKDMIAQLPNEDVMIAGSVGAQLAKLRQIATGLDLVAENVVDSAKLDVAVDLVVDNLPNRTVVFCWHRAAANAMKDRLAAKDVKVALVHGGITPKIRDLAIDDFKTGDAQVLVATIATVGESQNFQVANQVVFVEHSWTQVAMDQARDRVYRNGQKQRVTVVDIVARATIDTQRILPKLASKDALAKMILGG